MTDRPQQPDDEPESQTSDSVDEHLTLNPESVPSEDAASALEDLGSPAAAKAQYSDEALEALKVITVDRDEMTDEQRQLRDKTARGMALVATRTVVVRGLGLFGTIFLARYLTPSEYGIVAFGLTLIIIGRFFADGGLGAGLLRRETRPERFELQALLAFQQAMVWPVVVVGSLLAWFVLDLGGPPGTSSHNEGALTITLMLAAMGIDVLRVANAIACERDLEYTPIVRAEIAEFLVYNALAIVLVVNGMGVLGVGIANMVRACVGSGLILFWGPIGWLWPKWNTAVVKSLAKFGAYFQASWLATIFRDQGLAMLLLAISGTAALGVFDQARRLLVVVTMVFESAWRVGLPGLARMMEAGAQPKMLLERGLGLAGVAMTFPVVALVATCQWLVPLLLGPGWDDVGELIPWVGAAIMLTIPIATIMTTLLWAQDEPKKVFMMGIPALIATLGVGAAFMTKYDATGAGIGLVAGGVVYVASCVYLAREIFGPGAIPRFVGPILAAAGAVAVGILAGEAAGTSNFLSFLAAGFAGVAALLVLLVVVANSSAMDLWRFMGKAFGKGGDDKGDQGGPKGGDAVEGVPA